jgi:hypothetical protein
VDIRVRSNQQATKYVPLKTSATISNAGFDVNIVMTEDTEAT